MTCERSLNDQKTTMIKAITINSYSNGIIDPFHIPIIVIEQPNEYFFVGKSDFRMETLLARICFWPSDFKLWTI